jgi:uncharacterized protein (DUF697 family)
MVSTDVSWRRVRESLVLSAHVAGVVATGFIAVAWVNYVAPIFVFGGSGDTTAMIAARLQTFAHTSLKLAMFGRDVLVFLGLQ